jgi:hypothetical protein
VFESLCFGQFTQMVMTKTLITGGVVKHDADPQALARDLVASALHIAVSPSEKPW